jgi:uncharacterized protein
MTRGPDSSYNWGFMLTLNLGRIHEASEHFEEAYGPEVCAAPGDPFGMAAPATLTFDVFKDKDRYRLVGTVATALELSCSRCLEPFSWPVDAAFDLLYQPADAGGGPSEREIGERDVGAAFYENDTIDLRELVREQIHLAVPMKPLCSAGCHGLCPACGANLNRAVCACRLDWEDPRFAALRALRRDR